MRGIVGHPSAGAPHPAVPGGDHLYAVRSAGAGQLVLDGALGLRSVTACVVLPLSSRDETPDEIGVSHLLEHLVMSAPTEPDDVPFADWVSEVGGQANATTSKETVAYWARVPAEAALDCLGRLAAAVAAPRLTDELVTAERRVVVQELLSASVDPADQSTERFYAALFPGHPLGQPVGGIVDFPPFSVDRLRDRQRTAVHGAGAYISLVGPERIIEEAADLVTDGLPGTSSAMPVVGRSPVLGGPLTPDLSVPREAEYAYVTAGGRGAARSDPLWPAFEVLTAAVGGLPGSVLYHRLRTRLGVSYQLMSLATAFSDCGAWRVLAGCTPEDIDRLATVVEECLTDAAEGRLPVGAVDAARTQALGALLIDNEDPVVRGHLNAFYAVDGLAAESPVAQAGRQLSQVGSAEVAAAARRVLDTYTAVVST